MIKIAIDGPAGSGKSTNAKEVARRLNINYMDTGAMYRALAFGMMQAGVDVKDADAVRAALDKVKVGVSYEGGEQRVSVNGVDVTGSIRTPDVARGASDVGTVPEVRSYLVALQQDVAKDYDIIMDGRDIGTVVLKDAPVKVFLTASVEERAKRRQLQLKKQGIDEPLEKLIPEIAARDKNDSERAASPLKQAEDAVLIDNSTLTKAQVTEMIISLVKEAYGNDL